MDDLEAPMLDRLTGPRDLAGLGRADLEALAAELRSVIVTAVGRHGGHLGSNLGAVELTLALHRVLDSPDDILLWDTGHQTYPHKLLTGRKAGFAELRQAGGLSGYPSRAESEHDWVENSHASTVLAYAHGLVTAEASSVGTGRRVVAVIGDGALTGGMAYEGLNNLGNAGHDCLVVLNDNGRSYAPTASRLGAGLHGRDGATRGDPVPAGFFESLGLDYLGPVDGHDVAAVEGAVAAGLERGGPVVVHVLTQKGRGHGPAENDPVKCLHDTSSAKPGSYTSRFGETMVALGAEHPELVAVTAAMPDSTGLLTFGERFGDRLIDVGIAEQHAVTAAAGMAMGGLVPVVALYSTFLTRAVDQVVYDVGLHSLPVIFCLDRAGITGDDGASHHGVLDLVLLSKVPGITMFAPSSTDELEVMLREAVAIATGPRPGPVAIRWSNVVPASDPSAEVGVGTRARRLRSGDRVCLIGVGRMAETAVAAADLLAGAGIAATVWDPRCVRPLDPALLHDAARHPFVVTVEDGLREGGIGSAIADELADMAVCFGRGPQVSVLGTPAAYLPHGKPDAVLAELGLGPHGVAEHVRALTTSPMLDLEVVPGAGW